MEARTLVRRKVRTACEPGVAEASPRTVLGSLNGGRTVDPNAYVSIPAMPGGSTHLREKLEPDASQPKLFLTESGAHASAGACQP